MVSTCWSIAVAPVTGDMGMRAVGGGGGDTRGADVRFSPFGGSMGGASACGGRDGSVSKPMPDADTTDGRFSLFSFGGCVGALISAVASRCFFSIVSWRKLVTSECTLIVAYSHGVLCSWGEKKDQRSFTKWKRGGKTGLMMTNEVFDILENRHLIGNWCQFRPN